MNLVFIKEINLKIVEVFIFFYLFLYNISNREMGIGHWDQSESNFIYSLLNLNI